MQPVVGDTILWTLHYHQILLSLTIDQIISWALALIIGILARLLFGRRVPFGIVGTFLVALVGVWIATDIILINLPKDFYLYEIPLLKATLSGILCELLWYLIAYRSYRVWLRRRAYARTTPS